jgi:hypothetical protein
MRLPRLRTWLLPVALLGCIALALETSCSQEPEGERCDLNNGVSGGDSDCNDGLVCTSATELGTETDRCCPADRTQATLPPCTISTTATDASSAPPEGGSTSDGTTGADQSTPSEASSSSDASDASEASSSADAAEGG